MKRLFILTTFIALGAHASEPSYLEQKGFSKECVAAVKEYEEQTHLQSKAKRDLDKAFADLNNPNPIYYFSRRTNQIAVGANKDLLAASTKRVESALIAIHDFCGDQVNAFLEEITSMIFDQIKVLDSKEQPNQQAVDATEKASPNISPSPSETPEEAKVDLPASK